MADLVKLHLKRKTSKYKIVLELEIRFKSFEVHILGFKILEVFAVKFKSFELLAVRFKSFEVLVVRFKSFESALCLCLIFLSLSA